MNPVHVAASAGYRQMGGFHAQHPLSFKGQEKPPKPLPAVEVERLYEERRDLQPLTALCAFCDFAFVGLAGAARDAAAAHRLKEHPDAVRKRRRRPAGRGLGPLTLAARSAAVREAARLRGVEASKEARA